MHVKQWSWTKLSSVGKSLFGSFCDHSWSVFPNLSQQPLVYPWKAFSNYPQNLQKHSRWKMLRDLTWCEKYSLNYCYWHCSFAIWVLISVAFSCILAMFSFLATLFTLGNSNSYHFAVKLEIECHSYLHHYRFFCCYEKVGCCWFSSNNYSRLFEQLNVLYFDGALQCLIETSLILTLMIRIWKEKIKMNQQAFVETQYEGCISIYWLIDSLSFLDVSSKFCPI